MPPFFQRFWLLFFLKAVSHFCHFSNGCWLHNLFFKGYSAPFLQMFFAFSKQVATTFFPKAASNLFCKGCAYIPYPFLQRVFLLAFFPKEPPFSKGCHFCKVWIYFAAWTSFALNSKASALVLFFQLLSWAFQSLFYNLWFFPFFQRLPRCLFSKGCNSTGDNGMVLNQTLQTNMQCTFHLQHTAKSSWPMFEQKLVNQNRWNSPTENQYWNQYQNQSWNQYWNQYQNQYWNQYFYPKKSISKILILSIFFEKSISIFFHRKILIEINIGCSGFM